MMDIAKRIFLDCFSFQGVFAKREHEVHQDIDRIREEVFGRKYKHTANRDAAHLSTDLYRMRIRISRVVKAFILESENGEESAHS
jgi:hypothetical protein